MVEYSTQMAVDVYPNATLGTVAKPMSGFICFECGAFIIEEFINNPNDDNRALHAKFHERIDEIANTAVDVSMRAAGLNKIG